MLCYVATNAPRVLAVGGPERAVVDGPAEARRLDLGVRRTLADRQLEELGLCELQGSIVLRYLRAPP
jgi:hypothetical protein